MESYSLASEFCKVLGLLGLLIVFALFAVGLRKRRFMPGGSRLHLQIIDSLPLGKDRAICIVKAGQSHFLLGLTDHQISVLKEITNDELDSVSERQILDDPPTAETVTSSPDSWRKSRKEPDNSKARTCL